MTMIIVQRELQVSQYWWVRCYVRCPWLCCLVFFCTWVSLQCLVYNYCTEFSLCLCPWSIIPMELAMSEGSAHHVSVICVLSAFDQMTLCFFFSFYLFQCTSNPFHLGGSEHFTDICLW